MKPILSVKDLKVNFKVSNSMLQSLGISKKVSIPAVSNISFDIGKSEILGIIGESGCGKTTLAQTLIGLNKANSGSIKFNGNELTGLSTKQFLPYRKDIAMIFQDSLGSLTPRKNIEYIITEPYRIQGMKSRDLSQKADRLLQMVGLNKRFKESYPHQLSGGQARRVGVARALALDPKIIIADEPTAGLDVSIQGGLLNLLRKIKDETELSIIIITHNLNVARHVTDHIAIMYLGEFIEAGPTEEIFSKTQHPYTRGLLSANPIIDFKHKVPKIKLAGEPASLMNIPTGCKFHPRCPFAKTDCSQNIPTWQLAENTQSHHHRCLYPTNFTKTL